MAVEIPHNALIALCDGSKAVFLRNVGTETKVALEEERRVTFKDVINDGPSGAQYRDHTRRQVDEATFAKQIVHLLNDLHEKGAFPALVLAADPHTLGRMRNAMHKRLEQAIILTLTKELTNTPPHEVARLLRESSAPEPQV